MSYPVVELVYSKPIRRPSLKNYHTRQLMQLLNATRVNGGVTHYDDGPQFYDNEIKAELSKREHIPNKKEAKKIRRMKAKVGRQKGRRDK